MAMFEQLVHANDARAATYALQNILTQVRTADAIALWSARRSVITTAITNLNGVRSRFGSNFNYQLGSGTLMY